MYAYIVPMKDIAVDSTKVIFANTTFYKYIMKS